MGGAVKSVTNVVKDVVKAPVNMVTKPSISNFMSFGGNPLMGGLTKGIGGILGGGTLGGDGGTPYNIDYGSAPQYPGYVGGQTKYAEKAFSGIGSDYEAANKIKSEGMQPYQNSAYYNTAMAQNRNAFSMAKDQAEQQAGAKTLGAQSAMAMQGGINRGSRERLQQQGMKNAMEAQQDLAGKEQAGALGIGLGAENNRQDMLKFAPQAYAQSSAPAVTKAQSLIGMNQAETGGMNAYNMGLYGNNSDLWARQQEAGMSRAQPTPGFVDQLTTLGGTPFAPSSLWSGLNGKGLFK